MGGNMKHVLILDIGTGGVHTCLGDPAGGLWAGAYEEIHYAADAATKGYELDAREMFAAVKRTILKTLAESAVPANDIQALAVTSQRHGCVFLDRDDEPLMAFPNLDGRAQPLCERMGQEECARVFDRTARWPACWFPGARILWAGRERPELRVRIASLLMLNEYAAFRLTGIKVSEWTNAVETLLFDIYTGTWSNDLVKYFAAEGVALAPVVRTGGSAGNLSGALARELGLNSVPVIMAASDTQSATLGCGNIRQGDAVAVNGSTTPVFLPIRELRVDAKRRVYTSPYYGGKWALEGNCTMSGIVHRKLMDRFLGLARRLPGMVGLERKPLYDLFAGDTADPDGVTMHWGPVIADIGRTTRLPRLSLYADNDERDIFTAIIPAFVENLAFAIHENARQLAAIEGTPLRRIFLTGGGSASVRLQNALSVLNPDKEVLLTGELETTSRGAAIQAWIAVGEYASLEEAYTAMGEPSWFKALPKRADEKLLARYERWLGEIEA